METMQEEIIIKGQAAHDLQIKVETILYEIHKNRKAQKSAVSRDKLYKEEDDFSIRQIGADVTVFEEKHKTTFPNFATPQPNEKQFAKEVIADKTTIYLRSQNQNLGQFAIKQENKSRQIDETIVVVSPNWDRSRPTAVTRSKTVATKNRKPKTTIVDIYHDQSETADAVLNQMWGALFRSYDKAMLAKKLSKLNLPSQVTVKDRDALASTIVNRIHDVDDRIK
ncbi:MAG: hypothetical protein NC133_04250 [Prevotella sp.]|nr:hypothetical protein [Prevotella sp.]